MCFSIHIMSLYSEPLTSCQLNYSVLISFATMSRLVKRKQSIISIYPETGYSTPYWDLNGYKICRLLPSQSNALKTSINSSSGISSVVNRFINSLFVEYTFCLRKSLRVRQNIFRFLQESKLLRCLVSRSSFWKANFSISLPNCKRWVHFFVHG